MSTQVSTGPDFVQSVTVSSPGPEITAALDALRSAIAAHPARPASAEARAQLANARREAATVVSAIQRRDARHPAVSRILECFRALDLASAGHEASSATDAELASTFVSQGWPGLLAAMLLAPSWQCASAPALEKVPDWLWGDYVAWLFADAHRPDSASRLLPHLEELHRWVSRNAGSAAVRAAAEAWLRQGARIPAGGSPAQQRRSAELRGLMLTRLLARKDSPLDTPPLSRFGRPLRVGFVAEQFDASATTYRVLATIEHLPSGSFDVSLFALGETGTSTEQACRTRAGRFICLADELSAQLDSLRQADLDVLVYAGDLRAAADALTQLALHRVAPLQVADARQALSSGLPEIDLYLAHHGQAPEATAFTERLGILNSAWSAFSVPASASESELTREALELPTDVTLLATVVTRPDVSAATLTGWARTLAAAPSARLMVALAADAGESLCHDIEAVFAAHGVATNRVSLFPADATAPDDIRALLRLSDLYLDFPDAEDLRWTLEALKLSRPALALSAGSAAGALLRSAGLDELLAGDDESCVARAAQLANDAAARSTLVERLAESVDTGAVACFDTLAASDAFAALIETAFDELADSGRTAFRARPEPLRYTAERTASDAATAAAAALERKDLFAADTLSLTAIRSAPANLQARVARGQVLLAKGEAPAAVAYLLAAAQQTSTDSSLWFALAKALRADGKTHDSLLALETSLRMDGTRSDAWQMLAELAEAVGIYDLAEQAREIVRSLNAPKPAAAPTGIKLNLSGKLRGLRTTA